jgi:hypothetical protein
MINTKQTSASRKESIKNLILEQKNFIDCFREKSIASRKRSIIDFVFEQNITNICIKKKEY